MSQLMEFVLLPSYSLHSHQELVRLRGKQRQGSCRLRISNPEKWASVTQRAEQEQHAVQVTA